MYATFEGSGFPESRLVYKAHLEFFASRCDIRADWRVAALVAARCVSSPFTSKKSEFTVGKFVLWANLRKIKELAGKVLFGGRGSDCAVAVEESRLQEHARFERIRESAS